MQDYSNYLNEYEQEAEKPGSIKRFFFACAGAYIRILEVCPTEHTKYVGIGATILLTACLAVLSGSFAIYTLVPNMWIAGLFGLLWGALIFNLDRYIVSSIRKEGRPWHELGLALPRLLLALLISLVITKPIEIQLFHNQINAGLMSHISKLEKEAEGELDARLGLDSLRHELAIVDSIRWEYKQLREGKPSSFDFNEASDSYRQSRRALDSLQRAYQPRIKANEARRTALWNTHATRVYETLPSGEKKFVRWDFPDTYRDRSNRLYQINQGLQRELDSLQAVVSRLDAQRKDARQAFAEGLEEEIALLYARREELIAAKSEREAIWAEEAPAVRETARRYGIGFPARIQVLEQMKAEDESIWWMSTLIVMLFIMLETSPVFVKLISKRGPYDYLLSRIEHQRKIESLRSISNMNHDLSASMRQQAQQYAPHNGQSYEDAYYTESR
ncbi:MAG: DUF4407 domain-containing protein [Bacteroidetes bacterium]|nr:MAG: DUF4407 domain-containing protein [Bacteroidota bacterium]